MDISAWRKEYKNLAHPFLLESELPSRDPHLLFQSWFHEVAALKDSLYEEVNAVCVSTVSAQQRPSSRMVLLKGFSPEGFHFFTNYDSRKGRELSANPRAAMLFYWPRLHRQVRVEGPVERLPEHAAFEYWATRPVASRIGGAASKQSSVIPDRDFLEKKKQELEQLAKEKGEGAIAKPVDWGGFLLRPVYYEFWQGQTDRLHDRLVFSREAPEEGAEMVSPAENGFLLYRLSP